MGAESAKQDEMPWSNYDGPSAAAWSMPRLERVGGSGLLPYRGSSLRLFTLLDLRVPSLRRGHANLLCVVPILKDDPRRESGRYRRAPFLFVCHLGERACLLAGCAKSQM